MTKLTEATEPYVVGTTEARRLGGWGKTKLFQLIANGQLESFLDGSKRRITTASIHAFIHKKLQGETATRDVSQLTRASTQARARKKAQAEDDAA